MLARIRKAQQKDESGFTLIELLVVIIIIGILAAIAIPTFLNQRKKGWKSAIKSDLKNAAIAEESYATDNNGSYVAESPAGAAGGSLKSQGFNPTDGVTVVATVGGTGTDFTLVGTHTKLSGCTMTYTSTSGTTAEAGC